MRLTSEGASAALEQAAAQTKIRNRRCALCTRNLLLALAPEDDNGDERHGQNSRHQLHCSLRHDLAPLRPHRKYKTNPGPDASTRYGIAPRPPKSIALPSVSIQQPVTSHTGQSHRVVIIGGGFGGLYVAKALGRAPVSVAVIDRRNFHLFQ